MKVFGIGLNKTGTTSLGQAFAKLGFRHFKRDPAVFRAWRHGDFDTIFETIDGYDSFEDWPWPLMVPEIYARYPDAKFVLTRRRSSEAWLESIKRHALRTHPDRNPREIIFGARYPQGQEALYLEKYDQHLKDSRAFFATVGAKNQMVELCWEEGDGWAELCEFLEKPLVEAPFPQANIGSDAEIADDRLAANLAGIAAQEGKRGV